MKLIIAGCRHFINAESLVADALRESGWASEILEIIHGGAKGIDTSAHNYCLTRWPIKTFLADWNKHGKAAGPIRNRQMAEYADGIIAIWDGESRGTKNMIETAQELGLKVFVKQIEICK